MSLGGDTAAVDRQRLEYGGKSTLHARRRTEHGAGLGRRAGDVRETARVPARDRRFHAHATIRWPTTARDSTPRSAPAGYRGSGRAPAAPTLFLLDELLSGTNSHDRRIGAEAVVRGLVERGAIGLVTTHDLALAQIAETMGGRALNVHFEDHLENGEIRFDYRLRPGVVTRSNALELMRAVGLQV